MVKCLAPEVEYIAEPSVTADAFLWPHLVALGNFASSGNQPVPEPESLMPSGMFDSFRLETLRRIHEPFTGLVVLIDISNRLQAAHNENLLQSMTGFVAGLLGAKDFGCRTTDDEFVMICPGPAGLGAQRRLNEISEQLWQYQQYGNGTFSLFFSWGGIGAPESPLSQSLASAIHRMNLINRSRSILTRNL
jgi:hypothetical protein